MPKYTIKLPKHSLTPISVLLYCSYYDMLWRIKRLQKKKLRKQTSINKTGDTTVLHHDTDTIKLVQGIDHNGNLKDIPLNHNPSEVPILIDEENHDFVNFYCDFYSQLKHPKNSHFQG